MRSVYVEASIVIFICLLIEAAQPQASDVLAYHYNAIFNFEWWRLITSTFCHTNFNHLAMNIAGLVVVLLLFPTAFLDLKLWHLILFSSLFISFSLLIFTPSLIWYVGLSGVLHGLFTYGVMFDIKNKDKWGRILGLGIAGKIIIEQTFGSPISTAELIAAPVAINAHLYGAISGILFYFLSKHLAKIN
ncbi:MAG TPA: rhombosortase, partial [Psychromonas hadalis]|nr:rhombosortase [Psychromonas hadalis]